MSRGSYGSVQDELDDITIGDGYVLRNDGIAVALLEMTPPDVRMYEEEEFQQILTSYTRVLRTSTDRCMIQTYAVPLDVKPLINRLTVAQDSVPDVLSYMILGAQRDWLQEAWATMWDLRTIRWIISVPSVAPEQAPKGTWGELYPAQIVGRMTRMSGDPVEGALKRARRLRTSLSALGIEPGPQQMPAGAIRRLLQATLDPVWFDANPSAGTLAEPRALEIGEERTG